jgi:hypothetical protein
MRLNDHVTMVLEWRMTMKVLRSFGIALAASAAFLSVISTAQAHDSFNIGINIGGYGPQAYPVVSYRAVPQVVYYEAPRVYYPAAYVPAPVVVHRDVYYDRYSGGYYGGPRHHFSEHGYYGGHGRYGRHH